MTDVYLSNETVSGA